MNHHHHHHRRRYPGPRRLYSHNKSLSYQFSLTERLCILAPAFQGSDTEILKDIRIWSFACSTSHLTCYLPCRRHPPHRRPHRHRISRVVLYNFLLSVALRAAQTISRSSSIFSPPLTCYDPHCGHPHRHPH